MGVIEPEGDAACWLQQVCVECGALNERRGGGCWRCGASTGEQR